MAVTKSEYADMTKRAVPSSSLLTDTLKAYFVGGLICAGGQGLFSLYEATGLSEENIRAAVPITLIILTSILTGIGVYGRIATFAGAGTLVPITGFANSMVSPALEYQTEGRILGTAANMFKIAGPVIVYGTTAAFIYGIIYYIVKLF